ncbi:hypothetical protein GS831_24135 [Rhodococcus hoagii]|nr:hypothetical protein [Prescottella equi]
MASALVLSGCGGGDPSPEQRFADALSSGDVQAAADLTSDRRRRRRPSPRCSTV